MSKSCSLLAFCQQRIYKQERCIVYIICKRNFVQRGGWIFYRLLVIIFLKCLKSKLNGILNSEAHEGFSRRGGFLNYGRNIYPQKNILEDSLCNNFICNNKSLIPLRLVSYACAAEFFRKIDLKSTVFKLQNCSTIKIGQIKFLNQWSDQKGELEPTQPTPPCDSCR